MPTKKQFDKTYVSTENHELVYICKKFQDDNGDYLSKPFLYSILHFISLGGKRKVKRTELYECIESMKFKINLSSHEVSKASFLKLKKQ